MANATEQQDKSSDHGSGHEITIVVNGQQKTVTKGELSYDEVVNLAFDNNPPTGENIVITVTYRRGHGDKPEGTLSEGDSVKVKADMIFNVTATDKS